MYMRLLQIFGTSLPFVAFNAVSTNAETIYHWYSRQPLALTIVRENGATCTVVSVAHTQPHRLLEDFNDVIVETKRSVPDSPLWAGTSEVLQLIGYVDSALWAKAKSLCPDLVTREVSGEFPSMVHENQHAFSGTGHDNSKKPELEVYPLVVSGPSRNRVDMVFFGDGYTTHEKEKFIADATRLALDMSKNQTFVTVKPLMNFWAAFAPSHESGIGVDGVPKNTVFGLYRDGTELRAVYCSKKQVARAACLSLGSQCDYPILLGNDPLYGGLGGEFTISTASEMNGALVLRHELGHSIIGVGEEYDGGFAYFGVNAAQNVSESCSWAHWLSTTPSSGSSPREERAVMPFQAYPWTVLNKTSPWSASFTSSGDYSRHIVRFSLSGLPHKEDLKVQLDGADLGWEPRPDVGLDRWHYDLKGDALTHGPHVLSFALGDNAQEGTAQLCSAEIIEYGDESEFNSTAGYYGAFPTFSNINFTTFRPTNEDCLMRVVTSPSLCHVCLEGLWLSLLKRVFLIDQFSVILSRGPGSMILDLTLIALGQFRESDSETRPLPVRESYSITWYKNGVSLPAFDNLTRVAVEGDVDGTWRADVRLYTSEVRVDPKGLMKQRAEVRIGPTIAPEPIVI